MCPTANWARDLGADWHAPTGTVGLEWTPDPNTLAYLKYSRGYKSGGFNASTIAVNPESQPEHLDAFELGGKEVFNRTVQINGALFYYNYKDKQIPLTVPGFDGGPNVSTIVNIPKVQSYGAELETIWQPWTDMQILLDYSYLSAVIKGQAGNLRATRAGLVVLSKLSQRRIREYQRRLRAGIAAQQDRGERQLHLALHAGIVELFGQLRLEGQDARQHLC